MVPGSAAAAAGGGGWAAAPTSSGPRRSAQGGQVFAGCSGPSGVLQAAVDHQPGSNPWVMRPLVGPPRSPDLHAPTAADRGRSPPPSCSPAAVDAELRL